MLRPRRFLLLSIAAVVVGLAVGVWLLLPRTAITREKAACIDPGMTLEQVEIVMSGPARDESTGPLVFDGPGEIWSGVTDRLVIRVDLSGDVVRNPPCHGAACWMSDNVVTWVLLDADGRVKRRYAFPVRPLEEHLMSRIRRWLRL
jgi:hypothetical protein